MMINNTRPVITRITGLMHLKEDRAWTSHHHAQLTVSAYLQLDLFWGRFKTAEDLRPALHRLVDHGYLSPLPKPRPVGAGRPASPRYRVHKMIAETAQTAERHS